MGTTPRVITGVILVAEAVSGWLSARHYNALPSLQDDGDGAEGHVSIVIPARNEERRLPALLESLAGLEYADYEIVVVDDESSDRTGAVAAAAGARVLRVERLPPGWIGKAYACQVGANATRGQWILFTDADTVHAPRSLQLAVGVAMRTNSALVSLLARQECRSFWDRLLLPYAYALYFVGARDLNTSRGPAVANGQYLLVRREEYERAGGHAAVRHDMIEDVCLARLFFSQGRRVTLLRGEAYLTVHMYSTFSDLWEGFAKNAFRFVRVSPSTGIPTALAGFVFLSGATALGRSDRRTRIALLAVQAAALGQWYARFGTSPAMALASPLAAVTFQLIALDSMRRACLPRGTGWKGRRY